MKSAIVFYSMEGNTRTIANQIAKTVNGDLFEITSKKQLPTKGLAKYFWGGKSVMFNEIPEIEVALIDFSQYDVIYIGTPIWVSTMAPPLRAWCERNKIENKKIALFCTHGGGKFVKYVEAMKKYYPDNTFTSVLDVHEKNILSSGQIVYNWCSSIK